MLNRIGVLIASAVGIISTFLPWVYFPNAANAALSGVVGDGVLVIIMLVLVLGYEIIQLFKREESTHWFRHISLVVGVLTSILALYKIIKFTNDTSIPNTENYIANQALAGAELGYGLYLLLGASLLLVLLKLIGCRYREVKASKSNSRLSLAVTALIILGGTLFYNNKFQATSINLEKETVLIEQSINEMGDALVNGNYDTFVSYNHPVMVASFGDKEKMKELITNTMIDLKSRGNEIISVKFNNVDKVVRKGSNYQALVSQEVKFKAVGQPRVEVQKMVAVSNDGGDSWKFINVSNGKSDEEIRKIFPQLVEEFDF